MSFGSKIAIFTGIHILGVVVYFAVVDKYYCIPDDRGFIPSECFDWKAGAGFWEFVLLVQGIKYILPDPKKAN